MADKSFGVKELNLLNASGTPTVTSPNNLNLNANTVAISTSATVGNNLTVSGQINVGSNIKIGNAGVVTATSFVGSGSGLTGVASTDPSNVQATWKLGGGSGSGFTFTGPGQDGSEGNPDIYLVRGQRYLFDNTTLAGNHPFEFRNAANNADYTDGVSGAQNGLQYLNVQHDAPARLKYRCTIHTGSMLGDIYIIGGPEVISGVVTATTFVGNLTGTASANAVLTGSTNNQVVTVTGANAITGESNLLFSNSNLLIGLTATPVNSSTEQGVFLSGADGTQSVISSNVTPFVINRVGTGGNDRNCVEFRNNGSLKGTVGAVGVNQGIFFQSGTTEVMRITDDNKILVGLTTTGTSTSNNNLEIGGTKLLKVGNMYIGYVSGTSNNGSGTLVLHKLGQNVGLQFAGFVTVHSYTGSAYLSGCITARYNNDAVARDVTLQKANDGMNFQLVTGTISGESGSYLGIKKNGGGTGSFYINAFVGGNIESYGGLREISSGNWTTTTVHGSGIT